jgi:hypothetical protein
MDHDTTIEVGTFCSEVLTNPRFLRVVEEFEKTTCAELLSTKPGQAKEREDIYATFQGAQQFISFMQQFVIEAGKLRDEAAVDLVIDEEIDFDQEL